MVQILVTSYSWEKELLKTKTKTKKLELIILWSFYQFGISSLIQNNIFRLDISIDDISSMEKGQGLRHASRVELGAALVQTASVEYGHTLALFCSEV